MPEDRPLFTYHLALDELGHQVAAFSFPVQDEDGRRVRLVVPREDWESIDRPTEIEVDLRVRGVEWAREAPG